MRTFDKSFEVLQILKLKYHDQGKRNCCCLVSLNNSGVNHNGIASNVSFQK